MKKIYLTLNMKVHPTEVSFITRFNPLHLLILKENSLKRSETCSLYNELDSLFEPNGANLEPVVKLFCLHSFHLRCIIIFLKKNTTCSCCKRLIYLGENDDARLNLQEEENRVKKFFKELSNRLQDFNLLPLTNVKTRNLTTPDMVFVKLNNKILNSEK